MDAPKGYGNIFYRNVKYSGRADPSDLSFDFGFPCAGGAVYSPSRLAIFVFMVEGISNMFITGPTGN